MTSPSHLLTSKLLQNYLNTLQPWLNINRLKVPATKSTITLLTNYIKKHQHIPQPYTGLNTIPQPFSSHIHTHFTDITIQKLIPNTILGTPPPKYITQNLHYHARTEYTSAGFVAGTTLHWPLTKRESMTLSKKPAFTVTLAPIVSHTS